MQLYSNLNILWPCPSLGLEWKLTFPVLWPLLSFPILLAYLSAALSQHDLIVFLYLFAVITEEGFLISPCSSLEICVHLGMSSPFSFPFISLLFSTICKASSNNYFASLLFFFLGMILISTYCSMLWSSIHSSSGTLSDLITWIYCHFHCIIIRGLI